MSDVTTLAPEELGEPEFLERNSELLSLKEVYQASKRGKVRCACLIGEQGMGKTRLVESYSTQYMPEGESFIVTDFSDPDHLPIPARPVVLMLSKVYRQHGPLPHKVTDVPSGLEVDISTIQFIASKYREKSTDDPLSQLHGSKPMFWKAMTSYLHEHGRIRQLNLVFENVEQADATSIEFLEFFLRVRAQAGIQIFAVVTYRGDEKTGENPFQKVLPKIKKSEYYNAIELAPLMSRSIPSLVTSVIGRLQADNLLFEQAFKMSRGNPKMVMEFLRSLAAKGKIIKKDNAWVIDTEGAEISALPEEMEQRLIAGVKKLGKKHKQALEWSALVGYDFNTNLIGTLTGIKPTQLGYVVTDLVRDRYWDEQENSSPRSFNFPSPEVRRAICEQIKEKPRRKMHLAAAREYEKISPPPASRLAEHYCLGENVKKERHWTFRAGQESYLCGDWRSAGAHLERVLEVSNDAGKAHDIAEACAWLARVYNRLRDLPQAEETVRTGLASSAGAKNAFADELKREQALTQFRRRKIDVAFKTLKAVHDAGGPVCRQPEVLGTLADLYRLKNKPARSKEVLQEIDQDHPEFPIYRGYYEHQHGWLELMAGQWDEAWNSFQRAEDTHRELRDFGALAQTMYWQAEWQDLRGQTTDALNRIEGGVGYAADHEAPAIQARLMAAQARLLRKQGKMEESQQALVASHKLAKSTGVERVLAYIQLEIARWSSQAKSIEQGLVMGRKALEVFERLPDREGGAAIYAALGRLYLRQGNTKHAGKYFGFAQNYYAELGAEWQGAFLAPDRAAWAAQVDKSEQRQAFLEEGLALADKFDLAEARGLILVEQSKTLEDAQQVKESLSEAFQLLRDGGNMLAAGRARRLLKQKQTGRAPASS